MSALSDAGWIAPQDPGPTRWRAAAVVVIGVVSLAAWALVATGRAADALDGSGRSTWTLQLREDGRVAGAGSRAFQVRASGAAPFAVTRIPLVRSGRPLSIRVEPAPGIDVASVALRVVSPGSRVRIEKAPDGAPRAHVDPARSDDASVLVTVPLRALPGAPGLPSSGPLREVTDPFNDRVAAIREDRGRLDRLRSAASWLLPFGLAPTIATLWLWRRASRRFLSMRLPGPGTEATITPPSSLDPVGAAALVAGARPVDLADAFAGHVLDLVERRQLRMRRTLDPEHGAGALLGLAQVEDDGIRRADDPAVALLRAVAVDDGRTVALPDSPGRRPTAPIGVRRDWAAHVAARVRFERLVERDGWRRTAGLALVLVLIALGGAAIGIVAGGMGDRATGWLVAAVTLPWGVASGAWALDARRWRRVVRTRRLERAQWRAWGASGSQEGAASDLRNLPLLVAIGRTGSGARVAAPEAVALSAATKTTINALRELVVPPR